MKNQSTINKRQGSVNKRQTNINDDQGNINDYQIGKNEDQTVINDKTKFDLRFNNIWVIGISLVSMTFAIIMFIYKPQMEIQAKVDLLNQKVDVMFKSQQELTNEFKQWKTQAETRLGTVESTQNTVVSYVENHLQVKIR